MKMDFTGGVGSTANPTYYAEVEIFLHPRILFKTIAGFTPALEAQGIGLLGQSGFFESFSVTFDHRSRVFHIDTP
jgi:hypothetical protein